MKQNNHSIYYASPRTGMSILSIPDYSHLSETEIENMAKVILDNCNVKIAFKSADITPLVNKEGGND